MSKNNTLECWEHKNCGGSSKCGECITLKLKLLNNWVPTSNPSTIQITNKQEPFPESDSYNLVFVIVSIQNESIKGTVFEATFCKSDIHDKTLYYIVQDRDPILFKVNTSKCVDTIPIDN
jgi:hypothetical protein